MRKDRDSKRAPAIILNFNLGRLEVEAESELALERNANRFREPRGSKEICRLLEVRAAHCSIKGVAEVGSVENVETFEEKRELDVLCKLVGPSDPNVYLRKLISALRIWRQLVLIVAIPSLTVVNDPVAVDIACSSCTRIGENTVGSRRRELHNRRNLNTPRQVKN